jgi:hypothetical protein
MPKEQLVSELGKILKANGYTKKGINWRKELNDDFTLKFCVQGSRFEKGDYDVRIGVALAGFKDRDFAYYGHFWTQVTAISAEQVYSDSVDFFSEWLDKKVVYEKVRAIKEWRDRNPPEYLQTLPRGANYEKPPYKIPDQEIWVYEFVLSPEFLAD